MPAMDTIKDANGQPRAGQQDFLKGTVMQHKWRPMLSFFTNGDRTCRLNHW
jgi:hypothetical protein